MYHVTKELEFDMAHRLMDYKGACNNLHGHRYKIALSFEGEVETLGDSPEEGMVVDFGVVKRLAGDWINNNLDHATMLFQKDDTLIQTLKGMKLKVVVTPFQPTAENMAKYIFDELTNFFDTNGPDLSAKLFKVVVWETPTSYATYTRPIDKQKILDELLESGLKK